MQYPEKLDKLAEPEACASKDRARPALSEAYVRDGNLYATDSYVAVRIPLPNVPDGYIPREALKAIRALKYGEVVADATSIAITNGTSSARFDRPELGDYPNIDNVMPEPSDDDVMIAVNVDNLVKVAKALGTSTVSLRLKISDGTSLKPIAVRPVKACNDERVGLVMPVKVASR